MRPASVSLSFEHLPKVPVFRRSSPNPTLPADIKLIGDLGLADEVGDEKEN